MKNTSIRNIRNMLCLMLLSPSCYAADLFISLDNYEYTTNLGDIDLDYQPWGAIVGARFDLSDKSFLQIQYGSWSQDNADAFAVALSDSDFDSTLANIGFGYAWDKWDIYASYTDLNDEMAVTHGQNLEFRSFGQTDSSSLLANIGYSVESGNWTRSARLGLQYDDASTTAFLLEGDQMLRQDNDALYATLTLGADYFQGVSESKGWFLGANLNWYQELSSDESITQFDMTLAPPQFAGRGTPGRGNIGQPGNGATGVNRTFGENFGVLSLYATYMINESWSVDFSPSFGFAGDVNANSLALTLNKSF